MSYRRLFPILVVLVALGAVACNGGSKVPAEVGSAPRQTAPEQRTSEPALGPTHTATPAQRVESGESVVGDDDQMAETNKPTSTPTPSGSTSADAPCFLGSVWKTNFCKHSVPFEEIIIGGPPRDGIAPIDDPKFLEVADSPDYMNDDEPVISLEINGEAKAYPLGILIMHEIVNDGLGGVPVTVSYCPLCNTAIVFDRRVNGQVLDFGTTGFLRKSDLIMWDRQTESWWQQITGEAIVGELTGRKLKFIPAPVVSWVDFREAFPDGRVLSRDTGFAKDYDLPPYVGYDDEENVPFRYSGATDSRLLPLERVVGISIEGRDVAYPYKLLAEHPVINDSIDGQDLVIFYVGGTLSPFSGYANISRTPNRAVGSAAVYQAFVDGQKLTFSVQGDSIVDERTGSEWNVLGQAVDGPLKGSQLTPVVHGTHFWFAWAGFNPDTSVRTAEDVD